MKPDSRLGIKLQLKGSVKKEGQVGPAFFGLDSLVSYDWQLSLGGDILTKAEFAELSRLKVPLIQIRGEWMELRSTEIEAAIAFFQKNRDREMTLAEALRLGQSLPGQSLPYVDSTLPVLGVQAEGQIEQMLRALSNPGSMEEILPPQLFQGTLRPYQLRGVSWLEYLHGIGLGACLADDMGLGKTVELISFLLREREHIDRSKDPLPPALLICPMSVAGNWQKELERFAPSLRVLVHHGHNRLTGQSFLQEATKKDVVITTYALAQRDEEHLSAVTWSHVILDEAQNIKNQAARQTQKNEMQVNYNLTAEQASLYAAVVEEMLSRIESLDGIERRGMILAALTKLKQICNHPALFLQDGSSLAGRSGKLSRLEEMLYEVLAGGDRALIFTQYAGMGAMLRHHLQEKLGVEALFLHGGTSRKQRDDMVQRFQAGGPPIFILSLKAGGSGLNLTRASHVFHFDRWWNPAVENQATDRAFRIGQKKNVFVHKFVCLGTLEEQIDRMIEQKKALAESVIGTGESWLTELSNEALRDMLSLRRDALSNGDDDK